MFLKTNEAVTILKCVDANDDRVQSTSQMPRMHCLFGR